MELLECHVKEYAWGKRGSDSEVARLYAAGHADFQLGQDTPYAELWMGTHPDGPARLRGSSQRLSSHIAKSESASYLSNNNKREDIHLPFIMKVMSIRTTLSLQVHPTKEQATRLHERDPLHYPDRNHKPELAYALTRFELLCGFRPAEQMLQNLQAFPSLREVMGERETTKLLCILSSSTSSEASSSSSEARDALSTCFRRMLFFARDNKAKVARLVDELLRDLRKGGVLTEGTVEVIRRMAVDFPGDVGIFSPLYLNHMVLEPGECCYYAAEELHAYLSGECVECVGCSNNTIRAAMTPKFIDREALCEVLNYRMTQPEKYMVPVENLVDFPHVDLYAPDCRDFQLHRIRVKRGGTEQKAELPILACASIMVVVGGRATLQDASNGEKRLVKRGDIVYIPPAKRLLLTRTEDPIEAYRTFSYEIGPDHENRTVVPKELLTEDAKRVAQRTLAAFSSRPKFSLETSSEETSSDEDKVFAVESEMDGFL